jgi:hypothetical protein
MLKARRQQQEPHRSVYIFLAPLTRTPLGINQPDYFSHTEEKGTKRGAEELTGRFPPRSRKRMAIIQEPLFDLFSSSAMEEQRCSL